MENSELKTDGFRIKSGMTEKEGVILSETKNLSQDPSRSFRMTGKGTRALVAVGVTLALGLSSPGWAKCDAGTLVKGKNNYEYCISDLKMNWWSAFAWCEYQGRELATWTDACPGSAIGASCNNMAVGMNSVFAWTAEPISNYNAYYLNLDGGSALDNVNRAATSYRALCK